MTGDRPQNLRILLCHFLGFNLLASDSFGRFVLIFTCIPIRGQQGGGAGSPSVPRDPPAPVLKYYSEDRSKSTDGRGSCTRSTVTSSRPSGSTGAPSVPTAPTGSGTRGARSQRQRESDVGAEHQPHQRRDDKEPGGHAAGMEEGASPTARSGMISLADLDLIKVIIIISIY